MISFEFSVCCCHQPLLLILYSSHCYPTRTHTRMIQARKQQPHDALEPGADRGPFPAPKIADHFLQYAPTTSQCPCPPHVLLDLCLARCGGYCAS